MTCISTLQKIADSSYTLAGIESDKPFRIRELFHRFSIETGCAVYEWIEDIGLRRIGFEHISIPKTRTPEDVLAYILTARHFGIYLFSEFSANMGSKEMRRLMLQINAKDDGVRRLLVLLEDDISIPADLSPLMLKVQHRTTRPVQKPAPLLSANAVMSV